MILRKRLFTESHVTLGADELRIFLSTINLEIQRAAIISRRRDVAPVSTATRFHLHFQRSGIDGIEGRAGGIVTIQTTQIRMLAGFVTKCAGRNSPAPTIQHHFVCAHQRRQLRIEIDFQLHRADELMAHLTILRLGRNP